MNQYWIRVRTIWILSVTFFLFSCSQETSQSKGIDPNFIKQMDQENGETLVKEFIARKPVYKSNLTPGKLINLEGFPKSYKNLLGDVLKKPISIIIVSSTNNGCNNCDGLYEYLNPYLKSTSNLIGVVFFKLNPDKVERKLPPSIEKDGKMLVIYDDFGSPVIKWSNGTPMTIIAKNGKFINQFVNTSYVINEDKTKTIRRSYLVKVYKDILIFLGIK